MFFNPGYTITTDDYTTAFNLNYDGRLGIQKNVKNGAFQLETKISKRHKHLIGLLFLRNQSSKIISRNRFYFNYKYLIQLTDYQSLTLGTSIGLYNIFIKDNPTGVSGGNTVPDANLGFTYKYKKLALGISSNQIFNSSIIPLKNAYSLKRYSSSFAAYELPIATHDSDLKFQLLYNYYGLNKNDLASSITYYHQKKYGLGLVYRNLKGLSMLLDLKSLKLKNNNQLDLSIATSLLTINNLATEYQINLKYMMGYLSGK